VVRLVQLLPNCNTHNLVQEEHKLVEELEVLVEGFLEPESEKMDLGIMEETLEPVIY
jgi:hypothetical protein